MIMQNVSIGVGKMEKAGQFSVSNGILTVFYMGQVKRTQVENTDPLILAKLMLNEMVIDAL